MSRRLAVVLAVLALCAARASSAFEYLYAEANEGGSSGGHTAVRFGDEVFHFQNDRGLLVLRREPAAEFFARYALVDNRTVSRSRIEVGEQLGERLRGHFEDLRRAQQRQLDRWQALGEDRILLVGWLAAQRGGEPLRLRVPGAAYFDPGAPRASEALRGLRALLERQQGPDFLERRRASSRASWAALADARPDAWDARPPAARRTQPPFAEPFARRVADRSAEQVAWDVLEAGYGLAPGSVLEGGDPAFELSGPERAALARLVRRMQDSLARLASSSRPDRGRALLVGMARLLAAERTLAAGHWVVPDVHADDASRIAPAVLDRWRDFAPGMRAEARGHLARARRRLARAAAPGEGEWVAIEDRANRVFELEHALADRRPFRLHGEVALPQRAAPWALPPLPARPVQRLEADLSGVRERERAYAKRLEQLYAYNVFTHNCVSALFDALHEAQAEGPASDPVLDARVDGRRGFQFIPFVSQHAVRTHLPVREQSVVPSYRERRLARMRAREADWWVALRESNTLTARSYRRGVRDSGFLFFTDDALWTRPLRGAANLVVALGESLVGLVRWPVDGGATIGSGARGVLASLPELAFGSVRKGSNDWIPVEDRGALAD